MPSDPQPEWSTTENTLSAASAPSRSDRQNQESASGFAALSHSFIGLEALPRLDSLDAGLPTPEGGPKPTQFATLPTITSIADDPFATLPTIASIADDPFATLPTITSIAVDPFATLPTITSIAVDPFATLPTIPLVDSFAVGAPLPRLASLGSDTPSSVSPTLATERKLPSALGFDSPPLEPLSLSSLGFSGSPSPDVSQSRPVDANLYSSDASGSTAYPGSKAASLPNAESVGGGPDSSHSPVLTATPTSAAFSNAEAPSPTTFDEPTDTPTTFDEPTETPTGALDPPPVAQPDGDSTWELAATTFLVPSEHFGRTAMADKAPKTRRGSLFQKVEPKDPGRVEREDSHDTARLVRIFASLCLAAGLFLGAYTMFSGSDPTVVIPATPPVGHPQNPSGTRTTLPVADRGLDFSNGSDFSTGQDFSPGQDFSATAS